MTSGPPASRVVGAERFPVFDTVRIVAAVAVVLSHSFPLTGRTDDPFALDFGGWTPDLGTLSVATFFVISGFLITMSWTTSPKALSYTVKRFARIWPAFAFVVIVAALVLGPIVTTLEPRDYFAAPGTWSYIFHNLVMVPITFVLPGVFKTLPDHSVNGSLWTLPYEILAYVGVLVLGVLRLMTRRALILGLFVIALLGFRFGVATDQIQLDTVHAGGIDATRLFELASWFLAGAVLYQYRDRVPRRLAMGLVALVLVVAGAVVGESLVFLPAFAYLVIVVGTQQWNSLDAVHRLGDPSYGTYLYAWPIQQCLVLAGVDEWWALFLLAAPLAVACGYASWYLIERPGMKLARTFVRKRPRVAAP